MRRTRNANEFLIALRAISQNYERFFRKKIDEIRNRYTNNPTGIAPPTIDDSLEVHARQYIINELLQALNWRLNSSPTEGLPNMVPEAPIDSTSTGNTRFLDYLGFETDCQKPLLIVEAKRPRIELPLTNNIIPNNIASVITSALNGNTENISSAWVEYLETLRDYVRSVNRGSQHIPKRVVMTNGNWLIVFMNPEETFIRDRVADPNKVLIWANRNEIEQRYVELYRVIEYNTLLTELPQIAPEELLFHIQRESVTQLMHGIHLQYFEEPQMYFGSTPQIKVAPVLFIGTQYGSWLKVERPTELNVFVLPHEYNKIGEHLSQVKGAAELLLNEVKTILSSTLVPNTLIDHYSTQDSLDILKGVTEVNYLADYRVTEFLIVTGHQTHYLKAQPSVCDCPYHEWNACQRDGFAIAQSVGTRLTENPRTFFINSEPHHCAHLSVNNAKSSPISEDNRDCCGPRSGKVGCAFCDIYSIDTLLCCRTCFLEEVCTNAPAFILPC